MCLHTHRRADRDYRTTTTTPPVRRVLLSFDDQADAVAAAVSHLAGFVVHLRHPRYSGDAKVVSAEPVKLVVAPWTTNGFARPIELDPRQLVSVHVYR